MTIPRRIRIDLATSTETAIRAAMRAVEERGCDVLLTDAGVLLQHALDKVSDYEDAQLKTVTLEPSPAP